jgi:hypothetical protein
MTKIETKDKRGTHIIKLTSWKVKARECNKNAK